MLSPHAIFEFTLPSPSRTKLPRTAGNSPRRKPSRVSSPSSPLITELSDVSLGYNIDKIMIRCLRGEDVSDCHPSIFPELIDKLWDQWDFLHRNGWEREADEAFRGYKMAKAAQIESQRKFYQCHLQKDLMARKKEANDELEVLEKKTDVIEKNMHIAHQKDRMALETKQKQESQPVTMNPNGQTMMIQTSSDGSSFTVPLPSFSQAGMPNGYQAVVYIMPANQTPTPQTTWHIMNPPLSQTCQPQSFDQTLDLSQQTSSTIGAMSQTQPISSFASNDTKKKSNTAKTKTKPKKRAKTSLKP